MKTWFGTIVLAYRTNPYRLLILENKETKNITPPSGAVEKGESYEETAARELREEIGWIIDPKEFQETSIQQEFIYGPQKKERAGDKGINKVLLLNANNLPEPQETRDAKNARWVSIENAKKEITFRDLREVVEKASELLLPPKKKYKTLIKNY